MKGGGDMRQFQRSVILLSLFCFLFMILFGCAPTVVVKEPPAPRVESKPPKPFPNAVWIDGHWKWGSGANDYVWVPGHWTKAKPGKTWIKGHWKKTPKGWKWVKGQWR